MWPTSGREEQIPRTSLDRYLTLLEHVFLVRRLPAWYSSRIKQITKAPKLLVSDSALLTHLSASKLRASLLHMSTARGAEVDFVLEGADGRIVGVEVKASATVRARDFRHLATLRYP